MNPINCEHIPISTLSQSFMSTRMHNHLSVSFLQVFNTVFTFQLCMMTELFSSDPSSKKSCWQIRTYFLIGSKYEVQVCHKRGKVPNPPPSYYAFAGKSFFGVTGLLLCHKWLWMVIASTLAESVLAGMWLNCFLSELYL